MKKLVGFILYAIVVSVCFSCQEKEIIYVAKDGSDTTGNGSKSAPFATLERARNNVRVIRQTYSNKAVEVVLREGTYYRNASFQLTEEDSGTKEFPIIYKAYEGEKVFIHGGVKIPSSEVHQITDTSILKRLNPSINKNIVEVDLKQEDIENLGVLRPVGFARSFGPTWAEVFVNNKPLSLAKWPNDSTVAMGKVIDKGSVPRDGDMSNRGATFKFNTDRPKKWKNQKDIWISGYFFRGWAEDAVELSEIDTIQNVFKTKQPSLYGFGSGLKFQRWYVYNILEEIDEPGEFYIDRAARKLYFYPEEKVKDLEISILEKPLVSIKGASNIQFNGINFVCSRGMGVYMERTNNNLVKNCTFNNLGIVGVCIGKGIAPFEKLAHEGIGNQASEVIGSYLNHIYKDPMFNREAGHNNGVVGCTIYNTGAGGIHLGGGDRKTLEAGNNYIEDCTIHDFNRVEKSYRAGILISGVGNRISNCEIFNAPSIAILLHGNDHLIEYNNIHHVCQEVHDQGALYYGRDPSERGHKVYYNFFHHLNSIHATTAIYHDDGACGMEVFGNVFYKPGSIPVLVGGGHDNTYTNNIFIDAELGISVDNRNQNWSKYTMVKGGLYEERLKMVNYNQAPYSTKYPHLGNYWDDNPSLPKRNTVSKNIFYNVKMTTRYNKKTATEDNKDWLPFKDDNWETSENPGFIDKENMNFMLKESAKAFEKIPGFQSIPFDKIGVNKNVE